MSFWIWTGALVAAVLASGGIFFDIMPALAMAMVLAAMTALGWMRRTAPHDHWREFRKRKPWEF